MSSRSTIQFTLQMISDVFHYKVIVGFLTWKELLKGQLVDAMESKYELPHTFECVVGKHISIVQPSKNPHDYLNVQGSGNKHGERVCSNLRINILCERKDVPCAIQKFYHAMRRFLSHCCFHTAWREYPNAHTNEEVILNNMLRSARKPMVSHIVFQKQDIKS